MANIQKKILIGEKWQEKKYGKLTILINKIIEKIFSYFRFLCIL